MTTTPAMPELPETAYSLFYEEPGDLEGEGCQYVLDDPGYTADQMRAYALATLQAQPAAHTCVYHAVPLVPGDARSPQTAACVTCGQPPRVSGAWQPAAAAVSDAAKELAEQLKNIANGVRICGVHDRRYVAERLDDIARAILALRPQAMPMSRKELGEATARAHIAFCLAKFDTYEEALMAEFQAHHGITAPAGGEKQA